MSLALDLGLAQEGILEACSLLESLFQHVGLGRKGYAARNDSLDGLLQFALREIGGPLLAAQTADDLEDRLDAAVLSPKLYHVNALALQDLRSRPLEPEVAMGLTIERAFRQVLSAPALSLLHNSAPVLDVWLSAQLRMAKTLENSDAADEMPGPWLVTDPKVPVEIAQVTVAAMRASACLLALVLAADEERRLAEDIGLVLVTHLTNGARAHLRLLAAFPQAKVPVSVVGAPLDLSRIANLHGLAERRVARLAGALA